MNARSLKSIANRRIQTILGYKKAFSLGAAFCCGGVIIIPEANILKNILLVAVLACFWGAYKCCHQVESLQRSMEILETFANTEHFEFEMMSLQSMIEESLISFVIR